MTHDSVHAFRMPTVISLCWVYRRRFRDGQRTSAIRTRNLIPDPIHRLSPLGRTAWTRTERISITDRTVRTSMSWVWERRSSFDHYGKRGWLPLKSLNEQVDHA